MGIPVEAPYEGGLKEGIDIASEYDGGGKPGGGKLGGGHPCRPVETKREEFLCRLPGSVDGYVCSDTKDI